jgi:ceramide glucosyltransferase
MCSAARATRSTRPAAGRVAQPAVLLNYIFGGLALLSLGLVLWQWLAARRFPLHERVAPDPFPPAVTILKPIKGCDLETAACLQSWFEQDYTGRVQLLFGVASNDDPACEVVRKLIAGHPEIDARLVVCHALRGTNAKVSKLVDLEAIAKHDLLVISDADVRVPPDLLTNITGRLNAKDIGLVNCFYVLANPASAAMHWEAVAINADFWSQVLQSQSLKPIDFALGAVMLTRQKLLNEIGGFKSLVDVLADDYQLGNRIARAGRRIVLSPVVVECWSGPMGWKAVWKHQLRWARTIRVCQPLPYFFSVLSNGTFWPLLWLLSRPTVLSMAGCGLCLAVRLVTARDLAQRITRKRLSLASLWLVPLKDLLQAAIWLLAFTGNTIEWRGNRMKLRRDGTMEKLDRAASNPQTPTSTS